MGGEIWSRRRGTIISREMREDEDKFGGTDGGLEVAQDDLMSRVRGSWSEDKRGNGLLSAHWIGMDLGRGRGTD